MRTFYNEKDFLDLLYVKNLKMHSQSIQQPARKSICVFLKEEDEKLSTMMDKIFKDLFSNKENIPAHLIS
jgi:division protein CdvB (Snf7/Vps24/ESCRT-III family)